MLAPGVVLATSRNELANPSGETLITMGDRVDHSGFGQGKKVSMRQTKPQTVYVSPQQVQRQREHKDKTKKVLAPAPDPATQLAKAWRIGKFEPS